MRHARVSLTNVTPRPLQVVEWAGDGSPLFAVTSSATLLGPLTPADVKAQGVRFGASGFGMLVEGGVPSPTGIGRAHAAIRAARPDAEEIAPRTVFATDTEGRIVLVAIDGVERLLLGITLTEAAAIFSGGASGFPFNISHAINMDGGGSTTFSSSPAWPAPAQVFNRPTDTDVGPISERAVTAIACIKGA